MKKGKIKTYTFRVQTNWTSHRPNLFVKNIANIQRGKFIANGLFDYKDEIYIEIK